MPKPWERRPAPNAKTARRKGYCIFTEGMTEELYFNDFGGVSIRVHSVGGGGALHIVSEAACLKRKAARYQGYDYYFVVFDCDNNSSDEIRSAIAAANKNGLRWYISNPCFELWFLLHFDYRETSATATELKSAMCDYIHGYRETRKGVFAEIQHLQSTAVANAGRLLDMHGLSNWQTNPHAANPSTNVHQLVAMLNTLREHI